MSENKTYTKGSSSRPADDTGSELGDENSFMKFMLSDKARGARERYIKDQNRLITEGARSGPFLKDKK